MSDHSITIKIGAQLEKSFNNTLKAAHDNLANFNAAISKEMTATGKMGAAAYGDMATAGKQAAQASRQAAQAGKAGATTAKGLAGAGKSAAGSYRDLAAAGKRTVTALKSMGTDGKRAAAAVKELAAKGKSAALSSKDLAEAGKRAASALKSMATGGKGAASAAKDMATGGETALTLSRGMAASGREITSLAQNVAGAAGKMGGAMTAGFAAAAVAAVGVVKGLQMMGKLMVEVTKYSVQVGKDFESAMSDASATAAATTEEYEKMEQAAMEMGKTTSKTATESAEALRYMSLAGWDVDTSISALPSVLRMSEASGMDLGQTSDLVTDSMAALGITVGQLPGYLDVATKAQNKSNQSAQQLMEAYIGVGGTMKNLNIPIEESATALGVLANRGLKGSEAGNALNAIMVNLTTGTGQAGKMMQQLGVSAFDSQGNFIGLEATLQQVNTALQGCSEEQRNAALAAIGGKMHVDALNSLMAGLNTTNEEGISEWAALTKELENCNGSLEAMAATKLDNLEGDLKMLESAAQDAGIKIYSHLNGPLRDFAQFGTQEIRKMADALENGGFASMAGAAGSALAGGLGMIVERLPEFLLTAVSSIISFVVGFAADLPAELLEGLIKGAPRFLRALPQFGVDIVRAIIKGILSLGSAPLKAVMSLFFGGGDDADAIKAGTEAAKAQDISVDKDVAAEASSVLSKSPVSSGEIAGDAATAGQKGLLPSMPIDNMPGQAADISNAVKGVTATTGMDTADREVLKDVSGGMTSIPMDAGQSAKDAAVVAENAPAVADTAPVIQSIGDIKTAPAEVIEPVAQAGTDSLAGMPEKTQPIDTGVVSAVRGVGIPLTDIVPGIVPDIPMGAIQPDIPMSIKALQGIAQSAAEDMGDVPLGVSQVSADVVADTATGAGQIPAGVIGDVQAGAKNMPTGIVPDIPMEMPQISMGMPLEAVQLPDVPVEDVPLDAPQIPTGMVADMATGAGQMPARVAADVQIGAGSIPDIPVGAPQTPIPMDAIQQSVGPTGDMPPGAAQMPIGLMADTLIGTGGIPTRTDAQMDTADIPVGPMLDAAAGIARMSTRDMPPQAIPPVRVAVDMPPQAIPPAEVTADVGTVAVDSVAVPDIQDTQTPSPQAIPMAQALHIPAIQIPPIDIGAMDVGDKVAQIRDILQTGGMAGQVIDMQGIGKEREDRADHMPSVQILPYAIPPVAPKEAVGNMHPDMIVAQEIAAKDTKGAPDKIPDEGIPVRVMEMPWQIPAISMTGIANRIREMSDMALSTPSIPDPDKGSVIDETLDKLSKRSMDRDIPGTGASPTFVFSPTYHIEGSGDSKKDIQDTNQMCMRDFERFMEAFW